jgi:carbon monoxide dehydrogenase subunit G
MDMSGEYRIEASIDQVWAAIQNPDILKAAIPGCEELDKTSDTEMSAKVSLKIGPVKAKFAGEVELQDMIEPTSLKIQGEGKGGIAGFAKGGADVQLAANGDETILTYTAKAQVGGKIAQLGSRLIQSTAAKLADKFFANLKDQLANT